MRRVTITNNSPAVLGFALASLAALGINILTVGASNKLLFMTYHSSLANPLTYVRFFTHVLGHGGWAGKAERATKRSERRRSQPSYSARRRGARKKYFRACRRGKYKRR